ncbi:GTPase-activating protein and VPS9 domain-containing protein 1 [Aplysia californica]|uniref:GTPase-activating protein and VPS9 domain-containing protein 1 n=1 Tax=Aplysia californica TaxID=6500 RepID=A0ABM0ZZ66_APLCA|nr:GTPase-activating protein and VPS9 domain-containing protein 1 [Aplysia californica]
MSLTSDLWELSHQLQQEHLFVSTERESLQRLYHNVSLLSERVFHTAWIARQQKINMQEFIDKGNHPGNPAEAYSVTNQLEETNFVDSYKVFSYHDSKYGELLKYLYENPNLLSATIIAGENYGGLDVKKMVSMTVTSVFGNCLFQEDEQSVLRLLKSLLEIQVANSDNPRRLIRRQNMSFSLVYKHLCDSLFSARLFLTAALYDPIMRLLMEDEWFFDIDPDKALVRFPPAEKLRRFGEPGTEENKEKLGQYRAFIVDKLVLLAERFIKSIKANIHCFPASLGWLVSQVYRVLTERGQVGMQEVRASCADLVFALFICPAICDPEPHGITSDVPISHIARHNLMQMAQIIQILAISQPEDIDVKTRDLYSRFDKGCMASVLDLFLEGAWEDMTEQITRSASSSSSPSPSPSFSSSSSSSQGASRSAVMLTSEDVRELIGFLRNTSGRLDEKTPGKRQMEQLLSSLPADMPPSAADNLSLPGGSGVITPSSGSLSGSPFSVDSPIGTPSQEKKPLFKTKGQRKKRSMTAAPALEEILVESSEVEANGRPAADVLVVSIYPPGDCPGMLTERKVLSSLSENESKKVTTHPAPTPSNTATAATAAATTGGAHPEIQEKRTRFSLSHDQESIGNASDYQEVISEAASSHSVEDENELETDNFSDMMSANVSGRGSPSISGRDTPLSQAGSVEENPPAPQLPVPVPETVRKENRVDVTDRFGKFEIKAELAMEREECKSTVSDTWSTDVLASDSEPPEQNQVDRLEEVAEEIVRPPLLGSEPISEMSETASDAWSTDVLASDTEDKHSELLKDLELDLNCGVGDRDEGDSSLGHDEGEENCVDLDPMCAVGGAETGHSSSSDPHHGEVNEPFPEVFPEPSGKSGEESGGERGAGERGGASRKGNNMLFQFQSGPNLQLPSIHRPPSQSLKHAEGRVNATVHALEGSGGGSTALLPPSGVSGVQTSSGGGGGARSKVRDSREGGRRRAEAERRGSHSGGGGGGGGDDVAAGLEFDPLSSGGGAGGVKHHSRAGGKEKSWGRGHKQGSVDLPLRFEPRAQPSGSSGGEVHPLHRPDVTGSSSSSSSSGPPSDLPTPPTGGQARSGSRDSGIDLWVKTNGQMSGSSSRPQPTPAALIAARSSLDSNLSPPRYNSHVPGRASLDSNMQRIQAQGRAGGGGGMTSTPDSGLHSLSYMSSTGNSSSVDSNTPPLEMENPLFHLQHSHAVAAPHTKGGDNPPRLGAVLPPQHPHNSLSAVGDPFSVAATAATSGYNNGHSLLAGEGELVDVGVKDRSQLAGEGGLDGGVKGHCPLTETSLKHRNRKLRRSTPQIEVTDIYTKISVIEDVREEGSDSEESLAQQQVSNLDERRLSSALILLNTFSGDNDEPSGEITPAESSPAHAVKDFTSITFADSTSLISVDADDDSLEAHAIDSQTGHGEGEVKRSEGDSSSTHRRQDSSGSSQSANSFKLNTSSKDQAGDNVSLYSTDKEVGGDGEEAAGSKGKKTSGPGFLRSVRDKFNKGTR